MTRLEAISAYAENETRKKQAEKETEEAQLVALIGDLKARRLRIKQLCDTANACLNANIILTSEYDYTKTSAENRKNGCFGNCYRTDAVMGFDICPAIPVTDIGFKRITVSDIGYSFITDGNRYSLTVAHNGNKRSDIKLEIKFINMFLNEFDEFEKQFYEYVDKIIGYNEIVDGYATFELQGPYDQGAYVCSACGYGNNTYGFKGVCEKCGCKDPDKRKYR